MKERPQGEEIEKSFPVLDETLDPLEVSRHESPPMVAIAAPSTARLFADLSVELQHAVLWHAMGWRCRLLSREHRDIADASPFGFGTSITFTPSVRLGQVLHRISAVPRLKHISFRANADLDCDKMRAIGSAFGVDPPSVDVSGCLNLTSLPAGVPAEASMWETWWLFGPNPLLTDLESVAAQLHALCFLNMEHSSDDSLGVQKHWLQLANLRELEDGGAVCWSRATRFCFAFCSHAWRPETYPMFRQMIATNFWPMLSYKSASIATTPSERQRTTLEKDGFDGEIRRYVVIVESPDGRFVEHYLWSLSKSNGDAGNRDPSLSGCWMTDSVISLSNSDMMNLVDFMRDVALVRVDEILAWHDASLEKRQRLQRAT